MRKRIIAIISLILSFVFTLTGCEFVLQYETYLKNPKEDTSEYAAIDNGNPREEEKLSGELEVQIWTNESDLQDEMWRTIINKFEEVTGVKVTAHIGSQVNTQMSGRWLDGNPPDVVALTGSGIPDNAWEASGIVADLTDIVTEGYVYGENVKISEVVDLANFSRSSKTAGYYRLPASASAYGLFYDANYLSQLGLSAPKNFTQLMQFIKDANAKGVAPFTTNGGTGGYTTWTLIMNTLAAYGQEFCNEAMLGTKEAWSSNEARAVFTKMKAFCDAENSMLKGTSAFDHTTAHIYWLKHDALLCGDGIWLPWEVKNNTPENFDMQYITSPLIDEDQKPAAVAYTSGMMVAEKAKNPENARAFIRFLYTMYAQQVFTRYEGYIPMRTDLDLDKVPGLSTASKQILEYLMGDEVNLITKTYLWGDLNEVINGVVQKFLTGDMTVDLAIKTISESKFAK